MQAGAGVVILAEEALAAHDVVQWKAQIADQPSWSDLPIIVLTAAGRVDQRDSNQASLSGAAGQLDLVGAPGTAGNASQHGSSGAAQS